VESAADRPRTGAESASTPPAARGPASRFSWIAPILLLATVGIGIWYFVFRDDRSGQVEALVREAREAMSTFEYGRAELLLRDAIAIAPGDGLLHHNLAVTYMRQGRFAEARTEYETAVALYPPEANEVRAEENWQLAQLDFQERRWKDAERHLNRAIADHPTRALLHHRLIDLQLLGTKNVAAADSSTMRFLKFCGPSAENLRDAAHIHLKRRSYRSASERSRQAVTLSDTMVSAYVILARSTWRAGYLEEALDILEDPMQRYPERVDLMVVKSGVLIGMKQIDAALAILDRALSLEPSNYEANVARMMGLYVKGDYQGALEQGHHCETLTEDENELRFLRGQLARFQDALEGRLPPEDEPLQMHEPANEEIP
jgi:tetratricopeptide (TPR) repeat protein